jgi:hypothetical protein
MGEIDRNIEGRDPKRSIGFSASSVFTGEDQKEFQCLLDGLCEQYEPVGPAEQDVIQTMASAIFRKRHMGVFQRAFEARMQWGSFFEYTGDPGGFARIAETVRQQANAAFVEVTAKYATEKVKGELARASAGDTETTELIKCETDETQVTTKLLATDYTKRNNGDSAAEDVLGANVKGIVDRSVAEIKEKRSKKTYRGAMSSDDVAEIVKNNTKIEFEAAIRQLHRYGPSSRREYEARKSDAADKLIAVFETVFGPGTVKEMLEPICREDIEQSLAKFGDLLTPERYAAELQFNELLDITIERSHDRLMKYQAARNKRLSGNISSLQPDWARKR